MSVDLVVDIPLFWIYLGEIIGRIIPELSIEERKTIFSVTLSQDKKTKGADEFIASTLQTIARRSVRIPIIVCNSLLITSIFYTE